MYSLTYFCRNSQAGYSIGKVMRPILESNANAVIVEMPCKDASPVSIIRNLYTAWKNRNTNRINHITGEVHYLAWVLPKCRTITTVHDLVFIKYHHYSGIKQKLIKLLFVESLKRNQYIVCISEKTKQEVLSQIRYPKDHIIVIPNSVSSQYVFKKKLFNSKCPTVLHIGSSSNKNLVRTIKALSGLSIKLRIIGEINPEIKNTLHQSGISYTSDSRLSDEQIKQEYIECDIVNFPSLYEGFGMPIIEAQAVGRVCITSNREPMKSVAGEGAILVDPENINSIRNAYISILGDSFLRERIIQNGLANVANYREDKVIDAYRYLYDKINDED